MKYKEWLHDWLELYEKGAVKPRTYKQYDDVINKRLIPSLGEYEMENLTPIVLQRYIVELSQKGNIKTGGGLAPNSVNIIVLVIRSSLSMAYDEIIAERVKQEETIGAKYKEEVLKIQQLKAKHYYQSALVVSKSLLTKYNSYNVENSKKLVSDISAVMQTAIHHVDSAKQYLLKGNIALAISEAAKAIDICDDFTDARQIMQKYPPQPVTNLRIGIEKNKVRIEWDDDSKQEFTSYTIIKKIGIAPTTDEDGAVVDEGLSVRFFEDSVVVSATPYYYAVFAERYVQYFFKRYVENGCGCCIQ